MKHGVFTTLPNPSNDDEMQEVVQRAGEDFYDSGMQKLVPVLSKCLDNVSDCVGN
jgi:hypothetical protein